MTIVGLMADPGLPETIARAIAKDLSTYLSENLEAPSSEQAWEVQVARGTLPITGSGMVPLLEHAERIQKEQSWDYLFYLLDLPQWHDDQPILSHVSAKPAAALISIPALGARQVRKRTKEVLLLLIRTMGDPHTDPVSHVKQPVRWVACDEKDTWYVVAPGRRNRFRLLAEMVRSNRPGRLLTALSASLAAAVATGAFGIFYASVWNMANESSVLRLAFTSTLSIVTFSFWLILKNQLWERAKEAPRDRNNRDNLATAFTVGISVLLLYIALYLVLFVGALIVITPTYLQAEMGHDISIVDYLRLTWLAASLGTFAGALGSNFDGNADIERATYSRRVHHRRKKQEEL